MLYTWWCFHRLVTLVWEASVRASLYNMYPRDKTASSELWRVILLFDVSCVITIDATSYSLIGVCPVSLPNGTTVCARDTPSQVTTNVARSECAVECLVTSNGVQCAAFNYNSTSQNCEVYNSLPNIYATSSDCVNYQVSHCKFDLLDLIFFVRCWSFAMQTTSTHLTSSQ